MHAYIEIKKKKIHHTHTHSTQHTAHITQQIAHGTRHFNFNFNRKGEVINAYFYFFLA